jgi:hypothetical protein
MKLDAVRHLTASSSYGVETPRERLFSYLYRARNLVGGVPRSRSVTLLSARWLFPLLGTFRT